MENVWNAPCVFSPSLICLDLCNLETQVRTLETAGIRVLHIDVLDGHFSPSMPLGLETVRQLRAKTRLLFDCHIMTTKQEYFIDELLDIGVDQIVFQAETQPHIDRMLDHIRQKGVRAGVALKPATPLSTLEYVLEKCDTVLLMLINPGYASEKGEKQVPYAERKIKDLRKMIRERGADTKIEIDGRVSTDTIRTYGSGDVDIFVTGSTVMKRNDLTASVQTLDRIRASLMGERV